MLTSAKAALSGRLGVWKDISPENSRPELDLNPDLCDTGMMFHHGSAQANWERVTRWVYYNPLKHELEICDFPKSYIDLRGQVAQSAAAPAKQI